MYAYIQKQSAVIMQTIPGEIHWPHVPTPFLSDDDESFSLVFSLTLCRSCFHLFNVSNYTPIAVAARCKARTFFACSSTGIVGSNPTSGMDVCPRLFRVCAVLCVGSGLATGWSLIHGVLPNVYKIKNLKKWQRSKGLQSHREKV
jgi:hypothetical protein